MKLQIFTIKKIPKVDSNHTCLAAITLESALKKHESYYPQVFLKQCIYFEKKVIRNILLVSLTENELELVRLVFQKI